MIDATGACQNRPAHICRMQQRQQMLSILLWILILTKILSTPLSWISGWIMKFFILITNWIGTLIQMVL